MNDILLIYPAYSYPRKSPPLGLAYLSAHAERHGLHPHIHDFNITPLDEYGFDELLHSRDWGIVGLSFMTCQFGEAMKLARIIRERLPRVTIVAGGPHPSSIPERTLAEIPGIDIVVVGEGEETLTELVMALSDGRSLHEILGICFREGGTISLNPPRPLISDLDMIPFPAWKYFPVERYNVFSLAGDGTVFALLSSRGCPNFCTFCDSHTIFKRRFRPRSAENIFEEIMFLHQTYGMKEFDFVDDLITVQKRRVIALCRLIEDSGIAFRWMANARVNTVDREMLQAMKDAGCIRVDFGVESGDPRVRELMRKNISDEQIRQAHHLAQEVGLSTGSFSMVGNLGEDRDSARKTVELLKDIGEDVMVSIACPFPGTELYRTAKSKGLINTEDWTRYVTSPTYTADFKPVMRTESLSESEILESFYYIHSFFARRKFQRRFGRWFVFSPRFYREWVFQRRGFLHRLNMAVRLVAARIKRQLFPRP